MSNGVYITKHTKNTVAYINAHTNKPIITKEIIKAVGSHPVNASFALRILCSHYKAEKRIIKPNQTIQYTFHEKIEIGEAAKLLLEARRKKKARKMPRGPIDLKPFPAIPAAIITKDLKPFSEAEWWKHITPEQVAVLVINSNDYSYLIWNSLNDEIKNNYILIISILRNCLIGQNTDLNSFVKICNDLIQNIATILEKVSQIKQEDK